MGRGAFLGAGLVLVFLKFHLDRMLLWQFHHVAWYPWNYLNPERSEAFTQSLPNTPIWPAWATLLTSAAPFLVLGPLLTLRRIRDLHWPTGLVALFFVPFVNLFFFALLAVLPTPSPALLAEENRSPRRITRWLARIFAHTSRFGAGAIAAILSALVVVPFVAFATMVLEDYGWGLFLGLPFVLGFFATLLDGTGGETTLGRSLAVGVSSIIFAGLLCVLTAIEGVICVVMAAPIAIPFGMVGSFLAWAIQDTVRQTRRQNVLRCSGTFAVLLPLLLWSESRLHSDPRTTPATTRIEVAAPPEVVWRHVVSFSELPPARELWFMAGIAHPLRAQIDGAGVGAIRYCEFSTGAFVEPITVWNPPVHLAFDVQAQPQPMHEWSPWSSIEPAHLDGFFRSRRGEFRLTPLDEGRRTLLEGTTWYEHKIWPTRYWRLWSDFLIHTIHRRVLDHIRSESEKQSPSLV